MNHTRSPERRVPERRALLGQLARGALHRLLLALLRPVVLVLLLLLHRLLLVVLLHHLLLPELLRRCAQRGWARCQR